MELKGFDHVFEPAAFVSPWLVTPADSSRATNQLSLRVTVIVSPSTSGTGTPMPLSMGVEPWVRLANELALLPAGS
ncbi:hypothetical protein C479_07313 [Halovivax asiaticus JCM 14624]|uniref:Uncharacterized protein n=1 Tax=Halovivax asiaticus JCM 14624 TaxID=1227490 RepID=M0BLC5_9EURY|nr:hypothetical protein C479_07313 [Halovivax asiaticus JCM 14624]